MFEYLQFYLFTSFQHQARILYTDELFMIYIYCKSHKLVTYIYMSCKPNTRSK